MNIIFIITILILIVAAIVCTQIYVSFIDDFRKNFNFYSIKLIKAWDIFCVIVMSIAYLALMSGVVGAVLGLIQGIIGISILG